MKYNSIQTLKHRQIYVRMSATIHTHYSQATHHCGVQNEDTLVEVSTHGPDSRVERNVWRVEADPTRDMTRISRVARNLAGLGGWGQGVFTISRASSGRVKRFSNLTGRIGSGQVVSGISRVRSGQVKTSQSFRRRDRVNPT